MLAQIIGGLIGDDLFVIDAVKKGLVKAEYQEQFCINRLSVSDIFPGVDLSSCSQPRMLDTPDPLCDTALRFPYRGGVSENPGFGTAP
jgi:hypothetical protein